MAANGDSSGWLVFDNVEIDLPGHRLFVEGAEVALEPKAFAVLVLLARAPGRVFSRDEILDAVWEHRYVTPAVLHRIMALLRHALAEGAENHRYLQTVRGVGYRLDADVRQVSAREDAGASSDQGVAPGKAPGLDVEVEREANAQASASARSLEPQRPARRKIVFAIIAMLALALAALAWYGWGLHATAPATPKTNVRPAPPATTPATSQKHDAAESAIPLSSSKPVSPKSIAVLPFANLSADKDNQYFADGMQDLILTKLADIGDLKVISRISTARYASHPDDLKTIARQLGVANILEGSVQKAGDSVLINVQLINAETDVHLWAQAYTRTLDNVFGVEGEVAGKIATALEARLSPAETRRLATELSANPAANDLFLRAEYDFNRGQADYDTDSWRRAIPLYRQAIAKAPDFALAMARLSMTESFLAFFGGGGENVGQLKTDARAHAEQALKIAPDQAEAHMAIGYCDYFGTGDYTAALKAFADVLRIRPNDAGALTARGFVSRRQGDIDAAIDAFRQAQTYDPRNSVVAAEFGSTYLMAGRHALAEQAFQRALAIDPHNGLARHAYALAIAHDSGDLKRALVEAQGDAVASRFARVKLLTYQRKYRAALALLDAIDASSFIVFAGPKSLYQARLYRFAGDRAKARSSYTQALSILRVQAKAFADSPAQLPLALAYVAEAELGLGNTAAGLAAVAESVALVERSGDRTDGPHALVMDAAACALAGLADKAVPLLSKVLEMPGIGQYYSPVMLWIDPAWDPIRKSPGFEALLKKYAGDRPAVVADGS